MHCNCIPFPGPRGNGKKSIPSRPHRSDTPTAAAANARELRRLRARDGHARVLRRKALATMPRSSSIFLPFFVLFISFFFFGGWWWRWPVAGEGRRTATTGRSCGRCSDRSHQTTQRRVVPSAKRHSWPPS